MDRRDQDTIDVESTRQVRPGAVNNEHRWENAALVRENFDTSTPSAWIKRSPQTSMDPEINRGKSMHSSRELSGAGADPDGGYAARGQAPRGGHGRHSKLQPTPIKLGSVVLSG